MASGCVTNVAPDVKKEVDIMKDGLEDDPVRNMTDFSDGLRCMDNMFLVFGMGDIVTLVEDMKDNTGAVKAGTRDMLISAISDMTRRSQAISVVTYGADTGNLVSFLDLAGQKDAYQRVPPYDIRGSISQMDKDIVRKQADIGGDATGSIAGQGVTVGAGSSVSASGSILGIDLSIITTHNMSVIPGVISRNSVAIYKAGEGQFAELGLLQKFGLNYSIQNNRNEGTTKALRALIEMAAIELFGKLLKVPYWKCMGVDGEHPDINDEIGDWFYTMVTQGTLTQYIKTQLYLRGYYNAELTNYDVDEEYQQAVIKYKQRLGLEMKPDVDLDFFKAFLDSTPNSIPIERLAKGKKKKRLILANDSESEPPSAEEKKISVAEDGREQSDYQDSSPTQAAGSSGNAQRNSREIVRVNIEATNGKKRYERGEEVLLTVTANSNSYLHCYYQNADKSIVRFFPNRFSSDPFLAESGQLRLPGSSPFVMKANEEGLNESIYCLAFYNDIYLELPAKLRKGDFTPLKIDTFSEISQIYNKLLRGRVGEGMFTIITN
ncbi:MAG: DUF4384 domain-containing protein [Gammaproteobacteria bacterium]|nr:DUF4384 domain-containing protein [Gammaproteobacteria bacterium]